MILPARQTKLSKAKIVCPLGKPYCLGPRCKYFDKRRQVCLLLAKKLNECLNC